MSSDVAIGVAKASVDFPIRLRLLTVLFFATTLTLFSSGRLGSSDVYGQLQASMRFVQTGRFSTDTPLPPFEDLWVKSPSGAYYEAHDIGNTLLFIPAALFGLAHDGAPRDTIVQIPLVSRVCSALTYALLSTVGGYFLVRLFSLFHSPRLAFLLGTLVFVCTPLLAYAKTTWDVMGAAVAVCGLLFFSARYLRDATRRDASALLMGLLIGAAGTFRFSLAPFLVVSVAILLALSRGFVDRYRHAILAALGFAAVISVSLVYNYVRTGNPFFPATTASQYGSQNALSGNMLVGLYGLIVSPNRGLLIFAPVSVLLLFTPFIARRLGSESRVLCVTFGTGAVLYVVLIAKKADWGSFGWGPRYLVPLLPFVGFAAGQTAVVLWDRWRAPLAALTIAAGITGIGPVLVNWSTAIGEFPGAPDALASTPRQHLAVWDALVHGIRGEPLPATPGVTEDPEGRAGLGFPDFWIVRLMERSKAGAIAGWIIGCCLVTSAVWSFFKLMACTRPHFQRGPEEPALACDGLS